MLSAHLGVKDSETSMLGKKEQLNAKAVLNHLKLFFVQWVAFFALCIRYHKADKPCFSFWDYLI